MIEVEKLKPVSIGKIVVYHPPHGPPERGELTSWNEHYVFVRFNGSAGGAACRPVDVTFLDRIECQ